MTTNAMLLKDSKIESVLASGLDRLIISLDSPFKENYEAVRHGAHFETVVENAKNFIKQRNKAKKPEVIIWMLGLESTIDGLPEMIKLVKEIGVDRIVLQNQINAWGKKQWKDKAVILEAKNQTAIIDQANQDAHDEKVNFSVNTRYTSFKNDFKQRCAWPWGGAFVASNGAVIPCCMVADPKIASMGNLLEQDFKEIWNNEHYAKLRDDLKNDHIPEYCQRCYKIMD
jgi:radical SAM protein with 4Fe4S-binding SPASM domain